MFQYVPVATLLLGLISPPVITGALELEVSSIAERKVLALT
jgi:hypothetical protein